MHETRDFNVLGCAGKQKPHMLLLFRLLAYLYVHNSLSIWLVIANKSCIHSCSDCTRLYYYILETVYYVCQSQP